MKIFIVIVLYKLPIESSISVLNLIKLVTENECYRDIFDFLIFDNGPLKQKYNYQCGEYIYSSKNLGVAGAYNYALNLAMERGCSWLILLDQDTIISREYIDSIIETISSKKNSSMVVAIVPLIYCSKKKISPYYRSFFKQNIFKKNIVPGKEYFNISALNSGSVINVEFLKSIGGFNSFFWLDYLDHWLFYKIFKKDKRVYVLNSKLQHNLSVTKEYSNISAARFLNIIYYEAVYNTKYCNIFEKANYLIRIIYRFFSKFGYMRKNSIISDYFTTIIKGITKKL